MSSTPKPDKVMQLITGGWATSILGSAVKHGIFNALDAGSGNAEDIANKAGISKRGAQALLDGLTGLGLISVSNRRYQNTPGSSAFLVQGKPSYLGDMAAVMFDGMAEWATLPEAIKTGNPTVANTEIPDNEFWHVLVPAIAALSFPVAQMAAERLGIANAGPVRWLDVGGGSGVWSAVWLSANKQARAFQLDWQTVNRIAKGFVSKCGVADRFETIDGDFHKTDFGAGKYDLAIFGHIAHQEAPEDNVSIFRKFRNALKPGGTLLINDFIPNDDGTGHPFALMFASQMLLVSKGGNAWRQADYRSWLAEAGFASVEFMATQTPATVVFAK
jgi:ubiquinone/menaquinone biosynthesis C-methylase UbiE